MKIFLTAATAASIIVALPAASFAQQLTPTTTPASVPVTAAPTTAAPVATTTPLATQLSKASTSNVLRQGTQILLTVVTEVNSKEHKVGQRISMQVAKDVIVDGRTVLARGTPAFGEVTKVVKKGAFGKSGKMEARVLFIQANPENVKITGSFDEKGSSGTAATIGAAILVGVFSAFVKGKSAYIKSGTEVNATVETDSNVTI